jgi:hypothetical protein
MKPKGVKRLSGNIMLNFPWFGRRGLDDSTYDPSSLVAFMPQASQDE